MPKKKKSEEKRIKSELMLSNTPTSITDSANIVLRGDGSLYIQLMSKVGDEHLLAENHRTVISERGVKSFIETMCRVTDHYPKKTKNKKK